MLVTGARWTASSTIPAPMLYRTLGSMGEKVSAIGIGGSHVGLNGVDNCNACHRSDGSGAIRTFPNLAKNEAVNAKDPISLIHMVLAGSMPSTQTAPSAFAMPDFGWRLSDAEVADVLSFVRDSWGNHAAAVSRDEVGRIRKTVAIQKTAR